MESDEPTGLEGESDEPTELEGESSEPPMAELQDISCAICHQPIEPDQEYGEAAYGPVHLEGCSTQTYRR